MKSVYPVIFAPLEDEKNTVLIEVPDLEIISEGFGMADAISMARDAIGLKGICFEDEGKVLPEPSRLVEINAVKGTFVEKGRGYVSLVDIDFAEYRRKMDNRTVRRNVTLPNWLNMEAEKAQINVSRVLQEALMTTLNVWR